MVRFPFRIGKAFLNYHWHPITISKKHYRSLEQERLAESLVSIESPFGSTSGAIVYSKAGYGPYYQSRIDDSHVSDRMNGFMLGEQITVELERIGNTVQVTLRRA
jgi:hypothetical protein